MIDKDLAAGMLPTNHKTIVTDDIHQNMTGMRTGLTNPKMLKAIESLADEDNRIEGRAQNIIDKVQNRIPVNKPKPVSDSLFQAPKEKRTHTLIQNKPTNMPKGLEVAIFRDTSRPKPDGAYNPVLWQFIIEKISNGGQKDGINGSFRKAFEPFAQAIPDTKVFLLNRPIFITENIFNADQDKALTSMRSLMSEEKQATLPGYVTEEDIDNAEPPFPCMWVESYEPHGEIFKYQDEVMKDANGNEAKQVGYWSLRIGFQKSMYLSVIDGTDHIIISICGAEPTFSRGNQTVWAALSPFMRCGWAATKEIFTEDHRKNIHRKYQKLILHANRIALINSDKALTHRGTISSGMRKYGFYWEVRGFYRRLHDPEGIGVNANGERVVKGKTWVKPHTKGDTSKPKIEKRWKVKM